MTTNVEVYDEAELAEITERRERESSVLEVRSKVFQGSKEEAEAMVDPEKECEECGVLIPVERQRVQPLTKMCVDCQQWFDDKETRKRKLTGVPTVGLFG